MPENWGKLERSGQRAVYMAEIASGTWTYGQLADRWGVSSSAVEQFANRHRERINEIKEDLSNELAGLWIAKRAAVLDALQEDAERLERLAEGFEGSEDTATAVAPALNARRGALDLASKLGGLQREQVDVNVTRVVHEVVGVEPEELT